MSAARPLPRLPAPDLRPVAGRASRGGSRVGLMVGVVCLGCAPNTDALQRDVANLRAEFDAHRRTHDEQRARLERMESRLNLLAARPVAPPPAPVRPAPARDPLDDLPVVRLTPPATGAAAAPPLDTRKPLRDLSSEDWQALAAPKDADADADKDDAPAVPVIADPEADAAFNRAFAAYRTSEPTAAGELVAFADRYPASDSADNALYLAALVHVRGERCADAVPLLERALSLGSHTHPKGKGHPSDTAGSVMLELGRCEADLGRGDAARVWFEKIVKQRPNTAEAAEALAALGDLRAEEAVATPAARP